LEEARDARLLDLVLAIRRTAVAAERRWKTQVRTLDFHERRFLFLFHRGHDELRGPCTFAIRRRQPAARHCFEARVETHAFEAMHGVIREARSAPATEAEKRHGHGDRDVDA